MNWLKVVPALWKDKSVVENEIEEAKKMDGTKPGWQTSTFWVKIFTVDLPVLYMGVKGFLPPKTAAIIEVVAMGIYTVYRTIDGVTKQIQTVKAGQPLAGGDTATANVTVKAS